jgi:hypothetical protein
MSHTILTLRITRRAIGAACLKNGEFSLLDGRHLNSTPDRTIPAARRYLDKLIQLTGPTRVVIDAPGRDEPSTVTARLLEAATELFVARGLPVLAVTRLDVLTAFGITRVVDRREIRDLVRILWPDIVRVTGKVQPYVADATAAAAYAECELALNPPPS